MSNFTLWECLTDECRVSLVNFQKENYGHGIIAPDRPLPELEASSK